MKKNKGFFETIIHLKNCDSTNTVLKKENYTDRTLIYTFNQTKGRGRLDKEWHDFKDKNLALSFLLKENLLPNNLWYIAAASLALTDLLENDFGIKNVWIKWPNDVYINEKKISGVLAEAFWLENKIDKLIIGIGINVNCTKADLEKLDNKAISVLTATGSESDMKLFFNDYYEKLSSWMNMLFNMESGASVIREAWINKCSILNKKVEWHNFDKILTGEVIDIDVNGYLVLKINDEAVNISSGEIKII